MEPNMLRKILNGLKEIIYPATCLACRDSLKFKASVDDIICGSCWAKIKRNQPPFCHHCGRRLDKHNIAKNICPNCIRRPLHFDRAFAPCVYDGVIKDLIHNFKYKNKDFLGISLSKLMIEFIRDYNLPIEYLDAVIPIPLHKTRLREREFNQAQVLSKHIGARFNKPVLTTSLIRCRYTRRQIELAPEQRFLNVKGSFSVAKKEEIRNKNLLLVDDVLTTAATSSEAAYALKDAGANLVFVLTLAN